MAEISIDIAKEESVQEVKTIAKGIKTAVDSNGTGVAEVSGKIGESTDTGLDTVFGKLNSGGTKEVTTYVGAGIIPASTSTGTGTRVYAVDIKGTGVLKDYAAYTDTSVTATYSDTFRHVIEIDGKAMIDAISNFGDVRNAKLVFGGQGYIFTTVNSNRDVPVTNLLDIHFKQSLRISAYRTRTEKSMSLSMKVLYELEG